MTTDLLKCVQLMLQGHLIWSLISLTVKLSSAHQCLSLLWPHLMGIKLLNSGLWERVLWKSWPAFRLFKCLLKWEKLVSVIIINSQCMCLQLNNGEWDDSWILSYNHSQGRVKKGKLDLFAKPQKLDPLISPSVQFEIPSLPERVDEYSKNDDTCF